MRSFGRTLEGPRRSAKEEYTTIIRLLNKLIAFLPEHRDGHLFHSHLMFRLGIDPLPAWTVVWAVDLLDRVQGRPRSTWGH